MGTFESSPPLELLPSGGVVVPTSQTAPESAEGIAASFAPEVAIDTIEREDDPGFLRRAWSTGVTATKAAVITTAIAPTNELICYGSFAYTQTVTNNPVVGAAAMGGATLIVEGASALAAADWVAKDNIGRAIDRINEKLRATKLNFLVPKRYIPEKISPAVEAGLALSLGTVAVMEAKQRTDPTRTAQQARRHGLFTAGWLSAYCAAEGALLTQGIDHLNNPKVVVPVLAGLAALHYGARKLKQRVAAGQPYEAGIEQMKD